MQQKMIVDVTEADQYAMQTCFDGYSVVSAIRVDSLMKRGRVRFRLLKYDLVVATTGNKCFR